MNPRNYELLGRTWNCDLPVAEMIEEWLRINAKLTNSSGRHARAAAIQSTLFYPTLKHLGFEPIAADLVRRETHLGVDLAARYFDDTWWRPDQMRQLGVTADELAAANEFNSHGLDKSRPDRELQWFEAFTSALFLGGLAGRWDDLAKIGSWFDATIEPEYQAGQIEDEYMLLFVCIAGNLAPRPMPGVAELLAKVKKCRTKRPRLLTAAWEAAAAADQAAFDRAFPETVKHFLSKPPDGMPYHWLAIDQSSIWLIAESRGLRMPPLPEKLAAAVVTRESAGMVP